MLNTQIISCVTGSKIYLIKRRQQFNVILKIRLTKRLCYWFEDHQMTLPSLESRFSCYLTCRRMFYKQRYNSSRVSKLQLRQWQQSRVYLINLTEARQRDEFIVLVSNKQRRTSLQSNKQRMKETFTSRWRATVDLRTLQWKLTEVQQVFTRLSEDETKIDLIVFITLIIAWQSWKLKIFIQPTTRVM